MAREMRTGQDAGRRGLGRVMSDVRDLHSWIEGRCERCGCGAGVHENYVFIPPAGAAGLLWSLKEELVIAQGFEGWFLVRGVA